MSHTTILLVLDSVGVGALPDADLYGDGGSNTLRSVLAADPELRLPNLVRLGLGRILSHPQLAVTGPSLAAFGRGMTMTPAKDTISGHWEMAGIVQSEPFRTFPSGFPASIVAELSRRTGRMYLGNVVASGTEIIAELGREHMQTGSPILYTSADSVLQLAAHEDVVPIKELYAICEAARDIMQGEYNVARIIARPFVGEHPFTRTANRKDYAVSPPGDTMMDVLSRAGIPTIGVGKICDIYARQGFTHCHKTVSNADGMQQTADIYAEAPGGLIFTNLVEFDSHYGHRNDPKGYGRALAEVDSWLGGFVSALRAGDWLFIVADHGCDPGFPGTDHTREYVPILAYSPDMPTDIALGDRSSLTDIGATIMALYGITASFSSSHFAAELGWGK